MSPGSLYAIGGAEAKLRRRSVLRSFVSSAGGEDARIVVIPAASSLGAGVLEVYQAAFLSLGVADVQGVRPESRAESNDPRLSQAVTSASGIFMTGGNQLKLASIITGTPLGDAIHTAYRQGATIGGTSAGASILSDHMIAFGAGGSTPKQRMSQLAVGLGLISGVVIDQHFQQRSRYGRLMSLVAQSPALLGVGIDEDTAAVITDGHRLDVVGRGAVTIVDGSHLVTNAYTVKRSAPMLMSGATVHVLPAGAAFDLQSRRLLQIQAPLPAAEVEEMAAVDANLHRLAHDIAANQLSPSACTRRARRGRTA